MVLCCAELTWLFGWTVGFFIIAQWLAHQGAQILAARRLGLTPGWRGLVPCIGVSISCRAASWPSREDEALVTLNGALAGLVLAAVLLIAGQQLASPALAVAAKAGFTLNLISLLPFRPFDGGRIFPGMLWRLQGDAAGDAAGADLASRRFIAGCRVWTGSVMRENPDRPRLPARVLGDSLFLLIFATAGVLALARIVLPPLAFPVLLLAAIAAFGAFIAALLSLDPRAVQDNTLNGLEPRRPLARRQTAPLVIERPWREAGAARTALVIYAMLVLASATGVSAA
jgi:hypothetical protein